MLNGGPPTAAHKPFERVTLLTCKETLSPCPSLVFEFVVWPWLHESSCSPRPCPSLTPLNGSLLVKYVSECEPSPCCLHEAWRT